MLISMKKVILGLLSLCTIVSALLLFTTSPVVTNPLTDLTEVDQIITQNLSDFRDLVISSREVSTVVDSLFTRKEHRFLVENDFPSTAYHIRLATDLRAKGLNISGKRTFPSQELVLYITIENTLIRRVVIQYQ